MKRAMVLVMTILAIVFPALALAGFGAPNNTGLLTSSALVYTGTAGLTSCLGNE